MSFELKLFYFWTHMTYMKRAQVTSHTDRGIVQLNEFLPFQIKRENIRESEREKSKEREREKISRAPKRK
jgi:hypothetical protein